MNEDKILAAISQLGTEVTQLGTKITAMEKRFDGIDNRLDGIDERLDRIEDDLAEVREHAEITRYATNQLGDWADNASHALNILPTKMFSPVE